MAALTAHATIKPRLARLQSAGDLGADRAAAVPSSTCHTIGDDIVTGRERELLHPAGRPGGAAAACLRVAYTDSSGTAKHFSVSEQLRAQACLLRVAPASGATWERRGPDTGPPPWHSTRPLHLLLPRSAAARGPLA